MSNRTHEISTSDITAHNVNYQQPLVRYNMKAQHDDFANLKLWPNPL